MSQLFISYRNVERDMEVARRLVALLEELGHQSVFLASDPALGISSGSEWEDELYRKVGRCQALIAVCSEEYLASKWCFAEVTLAKANGKAILPVLLDSCDLPDVLSPFQAIDWKLGEREARDRLARGLRSAGLDPHDEFGWQKGIRPPYPGLPFFEEADAGVFFGRDEPIHECLQALNRVRLGHGRSRWILLHGPSGSGKSSLVRAGVVPRLRRDGDHWIVVGPFRPGARPLQALAQALVGADGKHSRPWRRLQSLLDEGSYDEAAARLNGLGHDLAMAVALPDAGVLVLVDQLEEAFEGTNPEHKRFLETLRCAVADPDSRIVLMSTVRSDFLDRFQAAFEGGSLPFEGLPLGPVDPGDLIQVVQGPAMVDGLELEEGLAEALVDDAATADALPILAFALRELYERCGRASGTITMSEYVHGLGRLKGALTRKADEVLKDTAADSETNSAIRRALVSLVRKADNGRYVRRRLSWDSIPSSAHEGLEKFVRARLLISSHDGETRTLEVAHEALIRDWDTLSGWVRDEAATLAWQRGLEARLDHWKGLQADRPRAWDSRIGRLWFWLRTRLPVPPRARRRMLRAWEERWKGSLLSTPEIHDVLGRVPPGHRALLRGEWGEVPEALKSKWGGASPLGEFRHPMTTLEAIAREEGWFKKPLWREVKKAKKSLLRRSVADLPEGVPERWRRAWRFQALIAEAPAESSDVEVEGIPEVTVGWLRDSLDRSESTKIKISLVPLLGAVPMGKNPKSWAVIVIGVLLLNLIAWVVPSREWRRAEELLAAIVALAPREADSLLSRVESSDSQVGAALRTFMSQKTFRDSIAIGLPAGLCGEAAPRTWWIQRTWFEAGVGYVIVPLATVGTIADPATWLEARLAGTGRSGEVLQLDAGPATGRVTHLRWEWDEDLPAQGPWECSIRAEEQDSTGWTVTLRPTGP